MRRVNSGFEDVYVNKIILRMNNCLADFRNVLQQFQFSEGSGLQCLRIILDVAITNLSHTKFTESVVKEFKTRIPQMLTYQYWSQTTLEELLMFDRAVIHTPSNTVTVDGNIFHVNHIVERVENIVKMSHTLVEQSPFFGLPYDNLSQNDYDAYQALRDDLATPRGRAFNLSDMDPAMQTQFLLDWSSIMTVLVKLLTQGFLRSEAFITHFYNL